MMKLKGYILSLKGFANERRAMRPLGVRKQMRGRQKEMVNRPNPTAPIVKITLSNVRNQRKNVRRLITRKQAETELCATLVKKCLLHGETTISCTLMNKNQTV